VGGPDAGVVTMAGWSCEDDDKRAPLSRAISGTGEGSGGGRSCGRPCIFDGTPHPRPLPAEVRGEGTPRCRLLRSIVPGLLLLVSACGGDGGGGDGGGPAPISTLAYVVTTCDQPPGQGRATFQQALWVRQGERDPVKVMELPAAPLPLCRSLADTRDGSNSLFAGAFQRMGVSPDGEVVLFEVTYDLSPFRFEPWARLPEEQEGIFLA